MKEIQVCEIRLGANKKISRFFFRRMMLQLLWGAKAKIAFRLREHKRRRKISIIISRKEECAFFIFIFIFFLLVFFCNKFG